MSSDERMEIMIRNYNRRLLGDLKEMEEEEGAPQEALRKVIEYIEKELAL